MTSVDNLPAIFLRRVRAHPEAQRLPELDVSKPWVVNSRACVEGPENVLRYLARYTKRGPLPEKNIRQIGSERIASRAPSTCPHCGSQQFVRSDYTWPNRRAPPRSHPV